MALRQFSKFLQPNTVRLNPTNAATVQIYVRNKSTSQNDTPVRNQSSYAATQAQPKEKLQPNQIPFKKYYDEERCDLRREWAEQFSGTDLRNINSWWPDQSIRSTSLEGNIEQPIGTAKIPLAIAGPLNFNGAHAQGPVLAPMATTEGALVASVTRGAKAINECGGVKTWATQQRMTRGPMYICEDPIQAMQLGEWVKQNIDRIQEEVVCKYSRHAKLREVFSALDMEVCHLLMRYETGDAAGQNQTTICTWHVINWIAENAPKEFPPNAMNIKYYSIEGNVSADKKTSSFNALMGRGMSVTAQAEISEEVLRRVCGVSSDVISTACYYSTRISERINQQCGFNVNTSNVLGAMFTATGQDIACVHESALSRIDFVKRDHAEGGIKATMYIPSLVVGSVGGGTSLPTQKECLQMMDCYGTGKVRKLAEVIAGYCLALDLSTYSAVSGGHFADAHEKYGRNRPEESK